MAKSSSSTKRTGSSGGTRGSVSKPTKKGFQPKGGSVKPSFNAGYVANLDARQARQKKALNSKKLEAKQLARKRELRAMQVNKSLTAKERSRARKLEIGLTKASNRRKELRSLLKGVNPFNNRRGITQ